MVFGLADVELQGRGDIFMPHDLLDLVHRHAVIRQPRAVGVPQVVKTQAAELVAGYVVNGVAFLAEPLGQPLAGFGRQIRERNSVRRRPPPASLVKISPPSTTG